MVSLVIGGGHSIGVPLAVSAKRSFIVPSATMTVHPVRMSGLVVGVPQTYSYFEKMQDRIIKFVTDNSRVSEKTLRKMLLNTELDKEKGASFLWKEPFNSVLKVKSSISGGDMWT